MSPARLAVAVVVALAPALSRAQTMLDQEQRLIEIHSLLLDLRPLAGPGALTPFQWEVGLEAVAIPEIDGTTGSKVQITASDRTRVFPRPRLAVGLPAPTGFRAFAGLSYIPPFRIRDVSTHHVAAELGAAWVPGRLRVGVGVRALYADSRSPVTESSTRDTLLTTGWGGSLSLGWSLSFQGGRLEVLPWAGAGIVDVHGRFRVTSDGNVLESDHAGASLNGGVRLRYDRWVAVAELDAYPGRLVLPGFKVACLLP